MNFSNFPNSMQRAQHNFRGQGAVSSDCCRKLVELSYARWLVASGGTDSPHFRSYISELVNAQAPLLNEYLAPPNSFLRVANVKRPATALVTDLKCETCGKTTPLIVFSSIYLLVAWRLQMVFLSLIEGWQQESDDQIRIRWRPPSQGEQSNLRAIMDMYLSCCSWPCGEVRDRPLLFRVTGSKGSKQTYTTLSILHLRKLTQYLPAPRFRNFTRLKV